MSKNKKVFYSWMYEDNKVHCDLFDSKKEAKKELIDYLDYDGTEGDAILKIVKIEPVENVFVTTNHKINCNFKKIK